MSKILYLFLLGTCLVGAMTRPPETMPSSYGSAPFSLSSYYGGAPNTMPNNRLFDPKLSDKSSPNNFRIGDTDSDIEVSSHTSNDVPEESGNMLYAGEVSTENMLDVLGIFNNLRNTKPSKNSYYDPKSYMANTVTLLNIMTNVRAKMTKNNKTGRYTIKITIDPIWAPTDITTMSQDELVKQLGRKKKRNLSPQQTSQTVQKKSGARRVVRQMQDVQDRQNMRMRDIGLF